MASTIVSSFTHRTAGSSDTPVAIGADSIGEGATLRAARPKENRLSGVQAGVGFRYDFEIPVRLPSRIAAFQKVLFKTPATAFGASPATPPTGYTDLLIPHEGAFNFQAYQSTEGDMNGLYTNAQVDGRLAFRVVEHIQTHLLALDNTRADIVLQDSAGAYHIFQNVFCCADLDPTLGNDRFQLAVLEFNSGVVRDILSVFDISNDAFDVLNTKQLAGTRLEIVANMQDGTSITLSECGFTVRPDFSFAEARFNGYVLSGYGWSPTYNGLVTLG